MSQSALRRRINVAFILNSPLAGWFDLTNKSSSPPPLHSTPPPPIPCRAGYALIIIGLSLNILLCATRFRARQAASACEKHFLRQVIVFKPRLPYVLVIRVKC